MAGAVILACVVIGVLVGGVRLATAAIFGVTASSALPPAFLMINVLATMIGGGLGGYLCTRRAPEGRVTISAGLLFAIFLLAGLLIGRALATPLQPLWFQATVTLLGASGLLIGLVVGAASRARTRDST